MHVTLISPPQVFTKSQVTAGVVPPLGILYLASYLKDAGTEVEVIDSVGDKYLQHTEHNGLILRGLTFNEILDRIPKDTGLIGISSLYSPAYIVVKRLIEEVKGRFPDIKVVIGGAHPTVLPEYTLRDSDADIIVLGEGEETLLDLCRNLDDYRNVKGIAYKSGDKINFTEKRELIEDIDRLPFPDRDFINFENYFKAAEPHGCSSSGRWTTILSSRGCPYGCTFCTTPLIWRRRWRARSVENVIQEMVELHEKYGIKDFHLEDENLGLDKKWLHRFCDLLIEKKLDITWQPSNGMRAETLLSLELMEKMKESGCSLVVFTLESASERVRNEIIKKELDISSVENAVAMAKKAGLMSTCYFIIGLPGERLSEARETIDYAARLARKGLDECVISLFSMLPGCELFDGLYKKGQIKLDDNFFKELSSIGDLAVFKSWSKHISGKELQKLRLQGYIKFMAFKTLCYPLKTLRMVRNILFGRDQLKTERVLRTFVKRIIPTGFYTK